MRPTREQINILVCQILSMRATCVRGSVGCVITKNHRIVSSGYNGALGVHDCVKECDGAKPCQHAVHAELNAIAAAAREGISLVGAILYCSFSPCLNCARTIVQAGIKEVYYLHEYHTPKPTEELFKSMGISLTQVPLIDHEGNKV